MKVSLKAARVNANLTQKEVTEKMGWRTNKTLVAVESGNRELKISEIERLCNLYGCTIADILLPTVSQNVKF